MFRNGKHWRNSKFGEKINHWPKEDSLDPKKKKDNSDFSELGKNGDLDLKKKEEGSKKNQDGS